MEQLTAQKEQKLEYKDVEKKVPVGKRDTSKYCGLGGAFPSDFALAVRRRKLPKSC